MQGVLPQLIYEDLVPTRDYIRDVALVLSGLQRAFLPKNEHDWQYGLEVVMRGLSTQSFAVADEPLRASIDFVRNMVRVPGARAWSLEEYAAPEIYRELLLWLERRGQAVTFKAPHFRGGRFDAQQAADYAQALWWMDERFRNFSAGLPVGGYSSPILLYPHHFDLSLVWFPHNDERQLALGFSSGDDMIHEPYLYLTAYPEPAEFTKLPLPDHAYWQSESFSGAILPYRHLVESNQPERLFENYTRLFNAAGLLFG